MHNGFLNYARMRASKKETLRLLTFLERSLPRQALKDALERYTSLSTRNARLQALELLEHISSGNSVSSYLATNGSLPVYMMTTLRAGEETGELHTGIVQALRYYKTVSGFVRKLFGSLVYPFIVLLFCCVALLFLLFWFIPAMVSNFSELGLPVSGILAFLSRISVLASAHTPLIGLVFVTVVVSLVYLISSKRAFLLRLGSYLPLIRQALYAWDRHQFYLFLSLALRQKPDVSASLLQVRSVLITDRGRRETLGIYSELSSGKKFSDSIRATIFATPEITRSVQLGEETQSFTDAVNDIVESSQEKATRLLDLIKSLIEPGMTVIVGVVVTVIALLLLQPFRAIVEHIQF